MKNLSVIINVALGIAVAILYVLHFTAPGSLPAGEPDRVADEGQMSLPAGIVYVNFDTLLNNYDMFFDLQKQFLEKQQKLENDLNNSSRTYERQVADFQDKVQKGLVTRSQAQQLEMELMQVQQELIQQRDQFQRDLMEEEQVMNRQLQHSIYEFLDEYNSAHNYSFILSHTFGGPFLYTDKSLDITSGVIEGINRKYSESKTVRR